MNCATCEAAMPPGARFCPSCGTLDTQRPTVEERKLVTVIFCDLVGSTALSEALDPETLRSITLRYFAALREPIERLGGTVEKFIGDAIMAVFGVPSMHEDDARRAATAALDMLDALAALNVELETSLNVRLRVRIGVNTGPAVTSTDISTRQALVSGETVNIAARLEQNAEEGQILIGPMTQQAIGAGARTETVGPLRLKGKEAPVIAYRLLGVGEDDPELLRRFDLPFVGRSAEVAELDRALEMVVAGRRARLIAVYGEPGIGKTRLVREWLHRVGGPFGHGGGRCRPYGEHGSLAALADAIHHLLAGGVHTDRDALAILEAGLLKDGTPGPSIDGTCAALTRLIDVASGDRPVVITIDDCQWASDPLLDLLDGLTRMSERSAVLFVCMARLDLLDRSPGWGLDRSHSLFLRGLSATESEVMAATLIEVGAHLSPDWTRVLEAAGGNPFYLEQLLAVASQTSPASELPHSLHSLVGARIDALEHRERAILDLAAVLGREFEPHHVAELAGTGPEGTDGGPLAPGEDGDPVPTALTRLSGRRLIEPSAGLASRACHRFSNGFIHEVTYQAMAKRTRAERHERAANMLARSHVAIAVVASHLERAYRFRSELGLLDRSTEALRRRATDMLAVAGAQAVARSDLAWAGSLLGRAVELYARGEPGWATAARQLGEIQIAVGRLDEGRQLLTSVLDAASDPVEAAHARLSLLVANAPAVAAAAAVATETLPVFEAAHDELGQARTRIRMAQERQLHGRHAEADVLLTMALAHAVRCAAEPERALALGAIGVSLWLGPRPVPAAVVRCTELLAEHGAARPMVRVTLNCPLAVLLALDDQWARARACLAEAGQLAEELGYAEAKVVMPIFSAAVEGLAGQSTQALCLLDQAGDAARELAAAELLTMIAREAARLLLDQGRIDEAVDRLATATTSSTLLRSEMADLDGLRSRLAAATGAPQQAIDLAERAVAAAVTTDSPIVQAVAALDQAVVLQQLGRLEPAMAAAHLARRCFEEKGHRPGVRRAEECRARIGGGTDGG